MLDTERAGQHNMNPLSVSIEQRGFAKTTRRDTWWLQPLVAFLGLSAFIIYATWAAFRGKHYTAGPYLSPFYSPELFGDLPQETLSDMPAERRRIVETGGLPCPLRTTP